MLSRELAEVAVFGRFRSFLDGSLALFGWAERLKGFVINSEMLHRATLELGSRRKSGESVIRRFGSVAYLACDYLRGGYKALGFHGEAVTNSASSCRGLERPAELAASASIRAEEVFRRPGGPKVDSFKYPDEIYEFYRSARRFVQASSSAPFTCGMSSMLRAQAYYSGHSAMTAFFRVAL